MPITKHIEPTATELKAFAEKAFHDASSGKNTEALGLAALIRDTVHTADLFDELEALNIETARTFREGMDHAMRVSILEKYIDLLRSRVDAI
jgi:hypothetical protein